ncbi:MAG: 50S ribosomal protein L17 [Bacteroidetes bacterium]|nr:MAG: 50S ribosomal protein L17 [Bacteroidota bacterium]
MRHGDKVNNLGRKKAHRVALLRNLASELIVHKRIVTTLAKAKALRTFIEPLITKTKKNDSQESIMHNHRQVFAALNDKAAVKELFTVVAPKIADRPGGYTRIIKLGIRVGDNAERAMIELVDFNDVYGKGVNKTEEQSKRTRRGKKKADGAPATTAAAPVVEAASVAVEDAPAAAVVDEAVTAPAAEATAATDEATNETRPAE